jgi:hypothetical protein
MSPHLSAVPRLRNRTTPFSPAAQSASGAPGGFTDASGEFVSNNELVADAHKLYLLNHGGYNADANGNLYRTTTSVKTIYDYQVVSGGFQGAWHGHSVIVDSKEIYSAKGTIYENAKGGGVTNWGGIADASLGIVGGSLEVAAGVFGEILSGGLSTIAIVDGVGRIGMNMMRLAAYSSGNSSVGKALPSNLGGMAGKIYDGAILNKGFFDSGPAQNVLGISNDAAAFIFGGGSNMSVILNPP